VLLPADDRALAHVAAHLRAGGIAAFPTETVYGLGAVLWDEAAIAQVFARKARPLFDPLIAHVAEPAGLDALWDEAATPEPARAAVRRLTAAVWPGPLTVLVPKVARVPLLATAGLSLVGVRCPAHPVARALLAAVGAPLVAPSANRFGRVSPTTALAVVAELGADLLVLDGGPCAVGVESTVVAFEDDGAPVVLRPGGLSLDAVRAHTGREPRVGGRGRVEAPGQTASHYAPARPATLLPAALPECGLPPGRWAVLASTTPEARVRALAGPGTTLAAVEVLSAAGDSVVAAQRLFAALRRLDEADADVLLEPWSPNGGLADALRDRLRRAAAAR
jgi:L-threonylcarbamoyladenylate synthase